MKRALYIQREVDQVGTIEDLTSVFESIASIHISQIRDKVLASTQFFNEIWQIYHQLRRSDHKTRPSLRNRPALIAITSEGGLIGDIDQRIVEAMLEHPSRAECDLYMIGAHGAILLSRKGVKPLQVFAQPEGAETDVAALVALLREYDQTTLYYQTYVSLARQNVARIELSSAVEELGKQVEANPEQIISSHDYIFEPSLKEVIAHMEDVMTGIALSQAVLESKLAQFASRFNAMNAAKTKAKAMRNELRIQVNRAKRAQSDERTKEVISAMKAMGRGI